MPVTCIQGYVSKSQRCSMKICHHTAIKFCANSNIFSQYNMGTEKLFTIVLHMACSHSDFLNYFLHYD